MAALYKMGKILCHHIPCLDSTQLQLQASFFGLFWSYGLYSFTFCSFTKSGLVTSWDSYSPCPFAKTAKLVVEVSSHIVRNF